MARLTEKQRQEEYRKFAESVDASHKLDLENPWFGQTAEPEDEDTDLRQNWAGGDGLGPTAQGVPNPGYVEPGNRPNQTQGGGDKPSEDDRLQQPDQDVTSRPTPQPSPAQRQSTPGDDQSGRKTRRGPRWGSGMGGGTA
jgi:hypothetical protein